MLKKKKLRLSYKSNWNNATPAQKKEFQIRLDEAYDMLFKKVVERHLKNLPDK